MKTSYKVKIGEGLNRHPYGSTASSPLDVRK